MKKVTKKSIKFLLDLGMEDFIKENFCVKVFRCMDCKNKSRESCFHYTFNQMQIMEIKEIRKSLGFIEIHVKEKSIIQHPYLLMSEVHFYEK